MILDNGGYRRWRIVPGPSVLTMCFSFGVLQAERICSCQAAGEIQCELYRRRVFAANSQYNCRTGTHHGDNSVTTGMCVQTVFGFD